MERKIRLEQKDAEETGIPEPQEDAQDRAPRSEGETVEGAPKKSKSGGTWRKKKGLIAAGAVIIVLLVAGIVTPVILLCGKDHGAWNRGPRKFYGGRAFGPMRDHAPDGGRFQENMQNGEGERLVGQVTTVAADSLTVKTKNGDVTVSLTGATRYPGWPGMGQDNGGQSPQRPLATGDTVEVLAKKADSGSLTAISVRKINTD
jgi:hypothetical protein